MTLSDRKVLQLLHDRFVLGWINIEDRPWAGKSTRHDTAAPAKTVNTCSGHKNVQLFFLTTDGRVVHCLPGFWAAEDFLAQAKLAQQLNAVYCDPKLSRADKNEKFMLAHLEQFKQHEHALRYGSQLQGFDVHIEKKRQGTDFVREEGPLKGGMKTTDQVIHERLAGMPFVSFERFDVGRFTNFGQKHYAYHLGDHRKSVKITPRRR